MKKLNQNNNLSNTKLLERGGLMIEALAMLGLIAVVTPTMYKKSAERTLEVEDINTATTVRTYMNAVEAYMANEYGTFVSERQEGDPEVTAHTGKKATSMKIRIIRPLSARVTARPTPTTLTTPNWPTTCRTALTSIVPCLNTTPRKPVLLKTATT
jgi:hypothetical protein